MRVYHIISGDLWAGAEAMACHLLKCIHHTEQLQLNVILLNEGHLANVLRSAGLQVEVIDETTHSILTIVQKTRRILSSDSRSCCIVHAHRYKENFIAWLASRGKTNCRLISTQHGLPEIRKRRASFINFLKIKANFFLLKHCFNKTIAVSHDINRYFRTTLSFPLYKIAVIHNGIVIPQYSSSEQGSSGLFLIGSSGRLFPVKDFSLMVEISKCLQDEKKIRLSLAGEGPERMYIEKQINAASLQEVFTLEGHLDNMNTFYQKLDIYLNTSVHEGIPLTILEAMAHGLPVIAPRVGGIPEIVDDGVNGFLISERDAGKFAEKCLLLAHNEELRQKMSAAARKKAVECFSVERMTEKYLQVYADVLRGSESSIAENDPPQK